MGADGVVRWVRDRGRIREEGGRWLLDGSILDVPAMHEAREQHEPATESDVNVLENIAGRRLATAAG